MRQQIRYRRRSTRHWQKFAERLNGIPTYGFYLIAAGVVVIIWGLSALSSKDDQPEPQLSSLSDKLQLTSHPEDRVPQVDRFQAIVDQAQPEDIVELEMARVLDQLTRYLRDPSQTPGQPAWVDSQFFGRGVLDSAVQLRVDQAALQVYRYQQAEQAPTFQGDLAFHQFAQNVSGSTADTIDFDVDVQIYSCQLEGGIATLRLMVETNGVIREDFVNIADHGFRNRSTQTTTLWETTWKRTLGGSSPTPDFSLLSASVVAQEKVVGRLNSDRLFLDCTASILAGTGLLESQLLFGLDQWSRRIPGIDLRGHHGLAIGDVNGDALPDLYICQAHGLPNLLLIQNSDGSVRDASAISHTDLLDQSSSALLVDLDNDADADLVVATIDALLVFSNNGKGIFQLEREIVTGGNAKSVVAADYDSDGDLDLFVCKYEAVNRQADLLMFPTDFDDPADGGRNMLLQNDEGFEFSDVTEIVGILPDDNHFYSESAIWIDHDRDGDQDLYVANEFRPDQLFENRDGWFKDVAPDRGIVDLGFHRSVSVGEFNQDGQEDIFVSSSVSLAGYRVLDGIESSEKSGDFDWLNSDVEALRKMVLAESLIRYSTDRGEFPAYFLRSPIYSNQAVCGSAAADLNNDGLDDLIVANGGLTRWLSQDVSELFYSRALGRGLDGDSDQETEPTNESIEQHVARAAHEIADLCRSGYSMAGNQRNRCYLNIGTSGFANVSSWSGLGLPDDARAVATVDWDQDGDLDVIMTSRTGPQLRIFCNQLNDRNSSLTLRLRGTESNADAIGARVELRLDGEGAPLVRTVRAGSGHLAQSSTDLVFGIPKKMNVVEAKVYWPSGETQTLGKLTRGVIYNVVEGEDDIAELAVPRFHLRIKPSMLVGKTELPMPEQRAWFYPRQPLVTLQVQAEQGKWGNLTPDNGRARLFLFWGRNSTSDDWLRALDENAADLNRVQLDSVAILLDEPEHSVANQWRYAKQAIASARYGGDWGTLAPSSRDKLLFSCGEWFNFRRLPSVPFALLVDPIGHVCAFYDGQSFSIEQVLEDHRRCLESDDTVRLTTRVGLPGQWVAEDLSCKTNRLRVRFREAGYEASADELSTRSRRQRAHELTRRAMELGAMNDYPQAQSFFQQALQLDPEHAVAYVGLAELQFKMAEEHSSPGPEQQALLRLAVENFQNALVLQPANLEAVLGKADALLAQDQQALALEHLQEFLKTNPERYEIHRRVGRMLFDQRRYPEASRHLSLAFDHRPNLPNLAGDLGTLYLVTGQDRDALRFLRLANRLQPSDLGILRLTAEAEFLTGNFDRAVSLFKTLNEMDPNQRRAKNVLAWLLATCPYQDHRDGQAASKLIRPMVDLFGDNSPATLEIYAACFAENGNFTKAIEFQEKAIQLHESPDAGERYSEQQLAGMRDRLDLYRSNRPYRTADISQIPISRTSELK